MLKFQQIGISAMHKIFYESPSRRADYEKVSLVTKEDYPLLFCATRWFENQLVTKKAQRIWPKIVAVVNFWSTFRKSKHPCGVNPKAIKSYQVLLSKYKDQLISVKFQFFEGIAAKMNIFLKRFQTDARMVPFFDETLD